MRKGKWKGNKGKGTTEKSEEREEGKVSGCVEKTNERGKRVIVRDRR